MPRLSFWLVRLAIVHLVLGFTLGGLMLAQKGGAVPPGVWMFRLAHQEFLLVGFMLQLVFGVGFWILPRVSGQSGDALMTIAFILVNAGIGCVIIGDIVQDLSGLMILGRVCEVGAVVCYAVHVWPRVRSFREARA